jgi:plastocyanin
LTTAFPKGLRANEEHSLKDSPMKPTVARRCFLAALAAAACDAHGAIAAEEAGVVEGTVTYRADSQRPWRYGRYYIKRAKTGELAEAVVALHRRSRAATGSRPEPKTVTIDQKNFQFLPETVAIRVGDSVKFTNSDQATHNVKVSSDIASFNVTMPAGGSHTVRFDKAGNIRQPLQVGCVFHTAMQAWIFVFDHPHFQLTTADGRFRLEGVPPGQYDLEMRHPAGQLRWRKRIEVPARGTMQVDIAVSPDDKK